MYRLASNLRIGDYIILQNTPDTHKRYEILDIQPSDDERFDCIFIIRGTIEASTRKLHVLLSDYFQVQ